MMGETISPLSSFSSSSLGSSTTTAMPTPSDDEGSTAAAWCALSGRLFSILLMLFVVRSVIAFPSLRRCASNIAVIFTTAPGLIGDTNVAASQVYYLATRHLIPPGLLCQLNGGVVQAAFMCHSGFSVMYLGILFMYRRGNVRARRWTWFFLLLNVLIFVGLALYGALFGSGYVPRESLMYCWASNGYGRFDSTWVRRFLLFYLWIVLCVVAAVVALVYVLSKTWYMRQTQREAFRLIRLRSLYAVVQLFYLGFFLFDYVDHSSTNTKAEEILVRISLVLRGATMGFLMLVFIFVEGIHRRWKVRFYGPSEERKAQLAALARRRQVTGLGLLNTAPGGGSPPSRFNRSATDDVGFEGREETLPTTATLAGVDEEVVFQAELELALAVEGKDPYVQRPLSKVLDDFSSWPESGRETTHLLA